jgi:hypothetical protein
MPIRMARSAALQSYASLVWKRKTTPENVLRQHHRPCPDELELARSVQRELLRLGCEASNTDGIWGDRSRKALERLAKRSDIAAEGK